MILDILSTKKAIIRQILDIEESWFTEIKASEKPSCRENLSAFRNTRKIGFMPMSRRTLKAYLEHVKYAKTRGRNLMIEKYARMDNLIPPLKESFFIDKIVDIQKEWLADLKERYPHIFKENPMDNFANYLRSELETYSDKTLENYYSDIKKALAKGVNLVEQSYMHLAKTNGFSSLEDMNSHLANK